MKLSVTQITKLATSLFDKIKERIDEENSELLEKNKPLLKNEEKNIRSSLAYKMIENYEKLEEKIVGLRETMKKLELYEKSNNHYKSLITSSDKYLKQQLEEVKEDILIQYPSINDIEAEIILYNLKDISMDELLEELTKKFI